MGIRRIAAAALIAATTLLLIPSYAAAGDSVASYDANDVGNRLDLRSVALNETPSGLTRVIVTFWNRVPSWVLRRHVLWITAGGYDFRILRNDEGHLRIRGGDLGSATTSRPAHHADGYTYIGRQWILGTEPPPSDLVAKTYRKPHCDGPCRWSEHGTMIDRTPRVPI
jgi:hypothetical protein